MGIYLYQVKRNRQTQKEDKDMKIKDFLKTDQGRHWETSLKGCSKDRECEFYSTELKALLMQV